MTSTKAGVATAASAGILFGASNVATVFLLQSFTPVGGALWRAVVAAVLLAGILLVARWSHQRTQSGEAEPAPPMSARLARAIVIGLCGGPLFLVGLNLAVAGVGPTVTAFVSGLYAIFAAALAPFVLGEPLRVRVLAGLGCALVGCVMLAQLQPDPAFTAGFVAALAAAGVYAWYLVLGRRWSTQYRLSPQSLTAASIATTIAALAVWVSFLSPDEVIVGAPTLPALGGLLFMAVSLALGQTLVMASVRRITAARTAAFLLLNPVTAAVLAALILSERLSPIQLAGAALILVGMAVTVGLDTMIHQATSRRLARAP